MVSAAIPGLPGLAGVKTVRRRTSSMVLAPEMNSVGVSALFDNTATLEKVLPYRRCSFLVARTEFLRAG